MAENSTSHYLRILEENVTERRVAKERTAAEYKKVNEAFSLNKEEMDSVQAQYQPIEDILEPLKEKREELNQNIRERKNQIPILENRLERLRSEAERFENERESVRKEISSLMRQSKPERDRLANLQQKYFQLEKQRNELFQKSKEAERAFSEVNRQYLLALQVEKNKPLIIVLVLVLILVLVLVAFVWAASQLPALSLIAVVIVTFLVFFVLVITLLRQNEKLKEESFTQLAQAVIKQIRFIRQ